MTITRNQDQTIFRNPTNIGPRTDLWREGIVLRPVLGRFESQDQSGPKTGFVLGRPVSQDEDRPRTTRVLGHHGYSISNTHHGVPDARSGRTT
jgi:hypothetical protein